jgi:3D-(3,5/4)-trihydroxycyclohexane-1,2-dione acylhydrolase (decyclizing)
MTVVVLDNRGYGCINRLQQATGGRPFNNMLADSRHARLPGIDFAAHARSMGATAEKVADLAALEAAISRAASATGPHIVVIDTDAAVVTEAGGHWWDVAVPQVSDRGEVRAAREAYEIRIGRRT